MTFEFRMLHGTQKTVENHLFGVIQSGVDEEDRGVARLGVRCPDSASAERFTIHEGEPVTLSDGWSIRLVHVTVSESERDQPVLYLQLMSPDERPVDG